MTVTFPRYADQSNSDALRMEYEANWFAAAFLMPADLFREEWLAWSGDVTTVAERFGVSRRTAWIRAQGLGLVEVEVVE